MVLQGEHFGVKTFARRYTPRRGCCGLGWWFGRVRGVGIVEIRYVTVVNAVIANGSGGFGFAFSLFWMDYRWAGYCEGCWNWKRGHDWRVVILVRGRWWCILASLIHVKITQSVSLSPHVIVFPLLPSPKTTKAGHWGTRKLTWITLTPTPIPPVCDGGGAGPCIGICCSGPAHNLAACLFQCSMTRVKSSGLSD